MLQLFFTLCILQTHSDYKMSGNSKFLLLSWIIIVRFMLHNPLLVDANLFKEDCCSKIILTLGNSIKNINNNQHYEGIYTFSGFINGMDYFVHSSEQTAIWYYETSNGYYWNIASLTNLGNFVAIFYTHSQELKNKCPINNGYASSWKYSDNGYKYTDEIYLKCENDGNLFKQIFKEGNFWVPKMQKISLAKTLVECGSFCVADKVNVI